MRNPLAEIEQGSVLRYDECPVEVPPTMLRMIRHEFGTWPDEWHWKDKAVVTDVAPERYANDDRRCDAWLVVGHCAAPLIWRDGAFHPTVWLTPRMRRRGRGLRRRARRV